MDTTKGITEYYLTILQENYAHLKILSNTKVLTYSQGNYALLNIIM